MSLTSFIKGWVGEAAGAVAQKIFLDPQIYHSLNNVTIPTSNGTTQIDHVIVSRHGIFVVESKNMAGWIFGDPGQARWTQSLYGKKFSFQNPLRQNYRHIKSLQEFLGVEESRLISIVMFWGDCEFKTKMPENVMCGGYISYIKRFSGILFSAEEVAAIVDALKTGMLPKGLFQSFATRRTHLASLEARHNSTVTCPRCGAALILRTSRKGENAGRQFYGCSAFPQCRYMRDA